MVYEKYSEPSEDQTSISQSLDLHFEATGLVTEGILAGVGPIAIGGTSRDLFVLLGAAGVSHVYTICN